MGLAAWGEQVEMNEAVAMLTEAAAQGHMEAQGLLADVYCFGEGVTCLHSMRTRA